MNSTIDFYNQNAEDFIENTVNADMSELYRCFQNYVKPGANILDFGCGSGRDSKYFIEHGYHVTAIDGSEFLCREASQYIGQDVECMLFNQLRSENEFDGIWACSSILHVPADELPDIFRRLYKALKSGGYIYASFKYGDFSGDRNGRHFTNLTEEKLENLLSTVPGLNIIETHITGDVREGRADEKWLNIIIMKEILS